MAGGPPGGGAAIGDAAGVAAPARDEVPAAEAPLGRVGPSVDAFTAVLGDTDASSQPRAFYSRLCQAVARAAGMDRAVLFLYDGALRRVRAVGSFGIELEQLAGVDVTLEEAPIAIRALEADQVICADDAADVLPAPYVGTLGLGAIACVPVAAAGRLFGVLFADRAGAPFTLGDAERETIWSLGKLAALATGARFATRHEERARELATRLDLARDVHEQVIQRLFGVTLALDAGRDLDADERARSAAELRAALRDLRALLNRPLDPGSTGAAPPTTLRTELDRLGRVAPGVEVAVTVDDGTAIPPAVEGLLVTTLREAVANATKHARPSRIEVRVTATDGAVALEVLNDGVGAAPRRRGTYPGQGLGLRLAAFAALEYGGIVEFGANGPGRWRTRLVVPSAGGPE